MFSRLIESARAANVAIYTIDPRGLQAPGGDQSRDFEPFDVGALRDLASATGGRSVLNNDLNGALEKIAAENRAYYLLGYEPVVKTGKPRARRLQVRTKSPGVSLLHRKLYVPGEGAKATAPPLLASPLPVRELPIVLAPAAVATDKKKRGVIVPFEIGRDLRDGTEVEYSAIALDPSGKVVARASGSGQAKDGHFAGEVGLAVESKAYQVRLSARALKPELSGLAFAAIRVPAGESKEPECSGFVFEQPGPRAGLRQFTRDQAITISTLVSAEKLDGAISFGLGAAGSVPQRLWPVKLDQPLAKGLWRIALSLKAPLPTGNLEVRVMRDDLLLADGCLAQFVSR